MSEATAQPSTLDVVPYDDEFRADKSGYYTADFTPPTSAFPDS